MNEFEVSELSNGVRYVEVTQEASEAYEDLEAAIESQLGVKVSLQDEIKADNGNYRYPVVG